MKMTVRRAKFLKIVFVSCIVTFFIVNYFNLIIRNISQTLPINEDFYNKELSKSNLEIKWTFTEKEIEEMSGLGKWLISSEINPPSIKNVKTTPYMILIWKFGPFLENRHIKRFTSKKYSPWENCSVKCTLTYNSNDLEKADAVIFHIYQTKNSKELPIRNNYNQRWIFLTDEAPGHTFVHRPQNLSSYNNFFNWTMTYRMDSDIPVPYGRTVKLSSPFNESLFINEKLKKKEKLVAVMISDCYNSKHRIDYIKKLKEILGSNLDIIGKCLNGNKTVCPGNYKNDCEKLENYKFYLSFENSHCRQYFTEKLFWNAYEKFAIPVIMGPTYYDSKQLLPPNSFLHVDKFSGPLSLANYLKQLNTSNNYIQYHKWRKNYKVLNEHGYFGSSSIHYCRACQALHYNSINKKVYDNLENFWNKSKDCIIY
ncbi:4-galactosyl-N-acetylglucosaminide 3-alpha-L-fucosyltransferase FUT5-like [Leptopilina heterotoma]|uniref:4-galactosyl-N-acetylglucosaminide 3-alpha-L-fucosyltransferase FUT5-like n=1 Tax=Leptopilina heterotoma TaxID=63436 RepID=UPI001CA7EDA2|nr:4-galactosyl-N-acetylglucosaminide 3-alpha-L-fucosyltransferase FUT5-like [Leptopilina heterotoma]